MFRWAVFLLSAFALGDTLTLKNGRVISGTYLGGTTTAIRFLSADRVETIPITDIQRVSFDTLQEKARKGHRQLRVLSFG
jgi:hypothetical protein